MSTCREIFLIHHSSVFLPRIPATLCLFPQIIPITFQLQLSKTERDLPRLRIETRFLPIIRLKDHPGEQCLRIILMIVIMLDQRLKVFCWMRIWENMMNYFLPSTCTRIKQWFLVTVATQVIVKLHARELWVTAQSKNHPSLATSIRVHF